jgi:tricorn protease
MISARTRFALAVLALAILSPIVATAQSSASSASGQTPLLLRNPSLSKDRIAFLYADDVWTVNRQGGEAERLTSDGKVAAGPFFSPDGSEIAYSAHLNGNVDVYVMPSGVECRGALRGIRPAASSWAGHPTPGTF